MHDTIFALSSGAPPAAIAIVRISGAQAGQTLIALTGDMPKPRRASLRVLRHPVTGALLDRALVLVFPQDESATGEPVVELHLHGGRAVVAAVESAVSALGLRRAEPGEFTRRAVLNGKIDFAMAEGLGDLLMAETESQRRAALESAEGAISRQCAEWQQALLSLSAQIEAELEYSDEGDVGPTQMGSLQDSAQVLAAEMRNIIANPPIERLRDGIRIVLAGPPNSGKSTLLNAMVERDAAIVSHIAGTTRDRIEMPVQRAGIAYVVTDTAGLAAETEDPIERQGITRSNEAISAADILLWLGDQPPPPHHSSIWIHARSDIEGRQACPAGPALAVSAWLGRGVNDLWEIVHRRAGTILPRVDQVALNERQRSCVAQACDALGRAISEPDPLLFAEECRVARVALDRLTGGADIEAVFDALFSRFCLGK
jgi:tRNA modification GTPase